MFNWNWIDLEFFLIVGMYYLLNNVLSKSEERFELLFEKLCKKVKNWLSYENRE